jgi:hypothetical protein
VDAVSPGEAYASQHAMSYQCLACRGATLQHKCQHARSGARSCHSTTFRTAGPGCTHAGTCQLRHQDTSFHRNCYHKHTTHGDSAKQANPCVVPQSEHSTRNNHA